MKQTIVRSGQTWSDIAVEYYGRLEAVVELAAVNGAAVDDMPVVGQSVMLPKLDTDPAIVRELARRGAHPGTAYDESAERIGIFTPQFTEEFE